MSWWEFWKPNPKQEDFVSDFLKKANQEIPGIRPLNQLDFVVLDTETTGLDPKNDFVLSFGAVKISRSRIMIPTALELFPDSPKIGKKTMDIHEIMGSGQTVSPKVFARELLHYLKDSILVGHHVGFDIQMLLKICHPYGLERFPNSVIDTMNLAVRLDFGPNVDWNLINREDYSLDRLCDRYGIEKDDRHTAAGDAFLTAQLLLKLLNRCSKKGIANYKDLMKKY
jgi:DNA polymerase III subunit epsilon